MEHMETTYGVLVVGGGNAAIVAALSAQRLGARVAIFEAAPLAYRGGNSRFSSGIFRIPHSGLSSVMPLLDAHGLADAEHCQMQPYTKEAYKRDMTRTSKGLCDDDQVHVMLEYAFDTVKWMKHDAGVRWKLPLGKFFHRNQMSTTQDGKVDMPPWDTIMAMDEGTGLMESLWAAVGKTDIQVFYGSPVTDLIADGDSIKGIRVRLRDSTKSFSGQVILGCGGFEASPSLRRQFLGEGWDLVALRGTRFNTGTMMQKAIAAGAGVAGHFGGCHATPHDLHTPKVLDPKDCDSMSRYSYPYSVMVNTLGRRFMDEGEDHFSLTYAKAGAAIVRQPEATAFQIFDQKTLHLLEPRYSTASPFEDKTLAGLATKLGLDAKVFCDTIRDFNAATPSSACDNFNAFILDGVSTDDRLVIPKSNWALPIDMGPFVAYGVTCGITFTYGGLRTDSAARVLNQEGLHMPGLWAVGEISGGFFAHNYPGGTGLTRGAVFGRIAGRAAAERWRNVLNNAASS
ncbi:hypothetical protein CDD82_3145 [Ophiocordyceps australis]|uniref:FAD-dependent oxidoreductase 2 FAD-binding domain-containing protein n=1 Tax=Ophiocordyceps australis TaxID=1399860 RepID=A0A2C5XRB8_9HYPO|nr:hypothetical protein CDD82_3145 [Ophiocordyceps australis]